MFQKTYVKYILILIIAIIIVNPIVLSLDNENQSLRKNVSLNRIQISNIKSNAMPIEDLDPLTDIQVTVTIKEIRAFDTIDKYSEPDFFVKVIINNEELTSPIWKNQKHIEDLNWFYQFDVPDDEEFVSITIQLWDWNPGLNTHCDIACNDNSNANS